VRGINRCCDAACQGGAAYRSKGASTADDGRRRWARTSPTGLAVQVRASSAADVSDIALRVHPHGTLCWMGASMYPAANLSASRRTRTTATRSSSCSTSSTSSIRQSAGTSSWTTCPRTTRRTSTSGSMNHPRWTLHFTPKHASWLLRSPSPRARAALGARGRQHLLPNQGQRKGASHDADAVYGAHCGVGTSTPPSIGAFLWSVGTPPPLAQQSRDSDSADEAVDLLRPERSAGTRGRRPRRRR
jgi:hypothetical protein